LEGGTFTSWSKLHWSMSTLPALDSQ
jgi:hypothetical protein